MPEILIKDNERLFQKNEYVAVQEGHYLAINLFLAQEFGFLKRQTKKRLEKARKKSTDEEFQQWINAVNDLEMLEQKYQSLYINQLRSG